MVTFRQKGDFSKLNSFFEKAKEIAHVGNLDRYGKMGVAALMSETPVYTGLAASSWYYTISRQNGRIELNFCNSDIENGCPIAVILQYGHGTKNGGWVEGIDYINPALRPVFELIKTEMWKEVSSL